MESIPDFGTLVKKQRLTLGLTQQQLAERVSCSLITIKKIEKGQRNPSDEMARLLAKELRIDTRQKGHFLALARGLDPEQAISLDLPDAILPLALPPTPLVDRHDELDEILQMLRAPEPRLITLTGPGGVGKTRLALQAAHVIEPAFRDKTIIVNLASVLQSELFLPALAISLGLAAPSPEAARKRLYTYFAGKQTLLVLDNFEQILPAGLEVQNLLGANPQLKIIVTSRACLRVRSEQEYPVPPMGLPNMGNMTTPQALIDQSPAVDLFVRRVRAVRPGFQLTLQNMHVVVEICTRLDGLPLAMELAAARCKLLDPAGLLHEMKRIHPIHLLTNGQKDLPQRQQTIRATLDWSYELLQEPEKELFQTLGAFRGGISLEALKSIYPENTPTLLDILHKLTDHSLIWTLPDQRDETRFQMLATLREYAMEKLTQAGQLESIRDKQAVYFCQFVEQKAPLLRGAGFSLGTHYFTQEHENLRAVLDWCCEAPFTPQKTTYALEIISRLWEFWVAHGDSHEATARMEQVLALPEAQEPSLALARSLDGLGLIYVLHMKDGRPYLKQAIHLFEKLGDIHGQAWTLEHLAQSHVGKSDLSAEEKLEMLDTSLRLFGQIHAGWNQAWVHRSRASVLVGMKKANEALQELEQSMKLFRASGDPRGQAWCYFQSSMILEENGEKQKALEACIHGLQLARTLGIANTLSGFYRHTASLQAQLGMLDESKSNLLQCIEIEKQAPDTWNQALTLICASTWLFRAGHTEKAAIYTGAARAFFLLSHDGTLGEYENSHLSQAITPLKEKLDSTTLNTLIQQGEAHSAQTWLEVQDWAQSDITRK